MLVVEALRHLMRIVMTWKSTSSNGWEYIIMWEDLGSSPMYANCMLFNVSIILMFCLNVIGGGVGCALALQLSGCLFKPY